MELIDRGTLLAEMPTIESEYKYARKIIQEQPTVIDAIPVEWIEKHISEIGDDTPIAEAYNLLIEIWRAEQEEQNETI